MAVDQALVESAAASRQIALRFYQWDEPTLSLGYFQALAARSEHPASGEAKVVRRASGGGAILHDRELTYSLAIPPAAGRAEREAPPAAPRLYRRAHRSLIAALDELGISARLCEPDAMSGSREEPFMCFARRSEGDVLLGDHKIAGSAQRRYRGAVLQHGSILLKASPAAPELLGIVEVSGVELEAIKIAELWQPLLAAELELDLQLDRLRPDEIGRAGELAASRYENAAWTARK